MSLIVKRVCNNIKHIKGALNASNISMYRYFFKEAQALLKLTINFFNLNLSNLHQLNLKHAIMYKKLGPYKSALIAALLLYCARGAAIEEHRTIVAAAAIVYWDVAIEDAAIDF